MELIKDVNGTELYAARAKADHSGNDIETTYATSTYVDTELDKKQDTFTSVSDIQLVTALPSTTVSTVLYLIAE